MMKKSILNILMLVVALTALTGCTQNDGHIGDLFGTWRLEELTADGTPLRLYGIPDKHWGKEVELYQWSFQGELVQIRTLYQYADFSTARGTFRHTDGMLYLDFDHTYIEGTVGLTPPEALHLTLHGTTALKVTRLEGRNMTLEYTSDDDGVKYIYTLRKAF